MMCSFRMAVGMQLLWFHVHVYFVVLVISHLELRELSYPIGLANRCS